MRSVPMVEVEHLDVRYGSVVAVDDASLAIPRGALAALVGPSGCGKTSLLRAIAGFESPSSGRIMVDGAVVAGDRWIEPERRRIGMVFQQGALFPHLTVKRNVLYGVRKRADREEIAASALELVGLADHQDRYPDQLSGGQQQRVALARALAPSPKIVLLDEPFANLDASLRQRVREDVVTILDRAGVTALLVTHDQDEALSIANPVAVMSRGRLLQLGSPADIYHHPATREVAELIGEGQLIDAAIHDSVLTCCIGSARIAIDDGPALLLVRPEDIVVVAPSEGLPFGKRVHRHFFGHDAIDEVLLGDGRILRIRRTSFSDDEAGPLHLRLRPKSYVVFRDGVPTGGALVE
ncbi:MAG TPA: ABC transporter ATP-binding protein [Thermoanaerobaculia bacterium]|nr:ABC transporter ATP-binding protein [Thermoanaerobaculia bacterium]